MRVITSTTETLPRDWPRTGIRAANVELVGLLAASIVVLLGIVLTVSGRIARLDIDSPGPTRSLRQPGSPADLEPVLTMFGEPGERQAVARALHARATSAERPLEHVGGLAAVTLPASEIRKEPRYVELRARLARRPQLDAVPVLTSADLAAIKPRLTVRTISEYRRRVALAVACFLAAFWIVHLVRRWRRVHDDPVILPTLLVLCGIGVMAMIALRDPLRDTMIGSAFVIGVVAGLALFAAASEIDIESSMLRRAVIGPLAIALGLGVLLLVFGSGPGTSGAKVNLAGVQPVEAIRLLVILSLAAYFARRLEFLRELSQPAPESRPWIGRLKLPRWKDVAPVLVSMSLLLAFFFLQKDLGPALVMSCVFLALYGIARGRAAFVVLGFTMLAAGFALAYGIGFPATVRQRVMIWADPWNNGAAGGNQIAHGLWALSTGGPWGLGQGLGSPQVVPAGHTDFVLAVVGEEIGFAGVAVVAALYVLLCWRFFRIAMRAPGDYSAFVATGFTLALVVQALVIAGGLLGLAPLAGVVTPFLSYGKSSMLANLAAAGIVMGIARRQSAVRAHLARPVRVLAGVLIVAAATVVGRAMWVQVPKADDYAARSSLGEQADGGYRFEYNPRLLAAARQIPRGSIYDRKGLPLATSRPDEIAGLAASYRKGGLAIPDDCDPDAGRCYPLGGIGFHLVGDWRTQANWGARNSSYLERDRASRLQGYDDHAKVVDVTNPSSGARDRAIRRDYRDLLPLARSRYRETRAVKAILARDRDIKTTIDAGLQLRAAAALQRRIESTQASRGSVVVIDPESGGVLAAVSYPWPQAADMESDAAASDEAEHEDRLLDRSRYGLYPPGSIYKLVVAAAALRSDAGGTFACVRLPDGRVGNYVRGSKRPVRDDPLDTVPHGTVDLHKAIVVSCNGYF
ncbi:MAG: FtsW/RodA/SpoVE family cell cycle protein, partial [Vicinamibacterales bacterium]